MMTHPAVIATLFAVSFCAFWCLTLKVIARFGWSKLAARYMAQQEPTGPQLTWQSVVFGRLLSYNNCLIAHITPEGLHLSMPRFFRFAHPPLLIPWEDLHFKTEAGSLTGKIYLYEIGTPKITRFAIRKKMHRAIEERPGA